MQTWFRNIELAPVLLTKPGMRSPSIWYTCLYACGTNVIHEHVHESGHMCIRSFNITISGVAKTFRERTDFDESRQVSCSSFLVLEVGVATARSVGIHFRFGY